ncbi:hypothetical protein SAMN05216466_106205 [Paraburkholderia phenazinium]|uniref:Uncharacterized protein n=1 Tax=Paraburkholderia phenazinium TaxID=60549 RepID=A0A1G7YIE3_9BURK|nr:hypothetical protein [Paraburkholderia phenazinium]SDG96338.1 hypothetical protein SAMN05216466_106205 [Paraburkholderia phenazinium]
MPAHTFDGLDDDGLLTKTRIRQLAEAYRVERMLREPKASRTRNLAVRMGEREQTANRQAWRNEASAKRDFAAIAAR